MQRGCDTTTPKTWISSSTQEVVLQEGLCGWVVQPVGGVCVAWAPGPAAAWQPAWALAKNTLPEDAGSGCGLGWEVSGGGGDVLGARNWI